jgi:pantoate--beta-alanine ligase
MGNLHIGHLSLVERALQEADRVVVTIFVNPLQFGAGEDYDSYPRTLEEDQQKLKQVGADLLFAPSVKEVYTRPQDEQTRVEVPGLSDILCGASRPGHFIGVATIVCKLFNMVQPDVAIFGEKDFQQLLVIRRMTEDLCISLEIIGMPTAREEDGLACSSRNGNLTADERARAPAIYRLMQEVAAELFDGNRNYSKLLERTSNALINNGLKPDYFTIRRASDLALPEPGDRDLVILVAATLGTTRLIDNLSVTIPQEK